MKIEMGESLFYSWLRHVKECQIVQTNWTTSQKWNLLHEEELQQIMTKTAKRFQQKYNYKIYKQTSSLSQLLQQAECDALGVDFREGELKVFAVDVAFHESGVNYGDKDSTIMKIIAKSLRTAMCIYGYLDSKDAEIIFASPKINKNVLTGLGPCIADAQEALDEYGFDFRLRIIANDDFQKLILEPILMVSGGVSDTNELFIRSYKMIRMFEGKHKAPKVEILSKNAAAYRELKVGKLAQIVVRSILESGKISDEELLNMQQKEYGKNKFNQTRPVLVRADEEYDRVRYYKDPVKIKGTDYMLCSQWAEGKTKNDRPYLLKWIEEHS